MRNDLLRRGGSRERNRPSLSPLRNQRHERFCVHLAQGLSIAESYAAAGYSKNTGNASRLNANESIQARVRELQAETAANAKITIESICAELAEATEVAKSKGQAQAMVSASALRAKLAGLMVERVEVGNPGDFDDLESKAEIVDRFFERLIERFLPVDERDKQAFVAMIDRQLQEQAEFMAAIEARPTLGHRVDPRNMKAPWTEHEQFKPTSPTRIGYRSNGSKPKTYTSDTPEFRGVRKDE